MQQTSKYQFNLVEGSDDFSPTPLNQNMEKVEEVLENMEATLSESLSELESSITGTGSAASVALNQAKQELASQIQAVQAAASAAQTTANAAWSPNNLPFTFGSYAGQGDVRNTHTITVGFSPRVLIIGCDDSSINLCLFPGQQAAYDCDITWGETGVTLSGYDPEYRMDKKNANYYYWAWR